MVPGPTITHSRPRSFELESYAPTHRRHADNVRRVLDIPAVAGLVDFDHIMRNYHSSEAARYSGVVLIGPEGMAATR